MARLPAAKSSQIRAQTRRRLLAAAVEEAAAKGISGANVNHISTTAGFARGTIYNYFNSKQALITALIEDIAQRCTRFIADRISPIDRPADRLRLLFIAMAEFAARHPAEARVASSALFGHDPVLQAHAFEAYGGLIRLVRQDIVQAGMDRGVFRPADPQAATQMLMSLCVGSGMPPQNGNSRRRAEAMADFALAALGLDGAGQDDGRAGGTKRSDGWRNW